METLRAEGEDGGMLTIFEKSLYYSLLQAVSIAGALKQL